MPADKENATMVMSSEDKARKMYLILEGLSSRKIFWGPTSYIVSLTVLPKRSGLPWEIVQRLTPPSWINELPEVHKVDVPLTPIVSVLVSATYKLAKYLTKLLRPFVVRSEHPRKSTEFVNILQDVDIGTKDG